MISADFDGDGIDEVLRFSYDWGLQFYKEEYSRWREYGVGFDKCGNADHKLHAGDFDGDGRQDILCTKPEGTIYVITNVMDNANGRPEVHELDSECRGEVFFGELNADKAID